MTDRSVRVATRDELEVVRTIDRIGFLAPPAKPDEAFTPWELVEPERVFLAIDGDEPVGTGTNRALSISLPGGATLPAAGVTAVAVLPTHRRRGHLRRLMDALLDDAIAHREPVAILTASDARIYGRFGFGVSSWRETLEIVRADIALRSVADPAVTLALHELGDVPSGVRECFDEARRVRPGAVGRTEEWWSGHWPSPAWMPGGPSRAVVASRGGTVVGYAGYRRAGDGVEIEELVGLDAGAHDGLWRFFAGLELADRFTWPRAPMDTALRTMLIDPRVARVTSRRDDVWMRILDVPAVLGARSYSTDGTITLDVADANDRAGGRYRVTNTPDGAECVRTDSATDLGIDIASLAMVTTGAATFAGLAATGLIRVDRADALRTADAMFASPTTAWAMTEF